MTRSMTAQEQTDDDLFGIGRYMRGEGKEK